uniref:Uncharacterized protein n=1 Tax=Pseudictyota dubia TaxID=2749911 RepID=A0A7R9W0G3_9STRA|mmetsp:Transcript_26945/g.49922  ORF Transcript_26945/g.49922 Transcript_26945/m.49922 type:complete len:206 (+) Transcript_26945:229-846(+)
MRSPMSSMPLLVLLLREGIAATTTQGAQRNRGRRTRNNLIQIPESNFIEEAVAFDEDASFWSRELLAFSASMSMSMPMQATTMVAPSGDDPTHAATNSMAPTSPVKSSDTTSSEETDDTTRAETTSTTTETPQTSTAEESRGGSSANDSGANGNGVPQQGLRTAGAEAQMVTANDSSSSSAASDLHFFAAATYTAVLAALLTAML